MPNQFFPRGYYGYPYPQQSMFPTASDNFGAYPFMNGGMAPMQGYPYMQANPYMEANGFMPIQYDYPYTQFGYMGQRPYDSPQTMPGSMGISGMPVVPTPYGMMPTVPPAYIAPLMQPSLYGMGLQQPYMQAYQGGPVYDPQLGQYVDPAHQYWATEYPSNVYPGATAAYPGNQSDPNNQSTGFDNSEPKRRKRTRTRKHPQENAKNATHANANAHAKQIADTVRRQQEEELRQQAALNEAKLAQLKRQAAQEAAQKEAIRQELARRAALKQQAAHQAAIKASQQNRVPQPEKSVDLSNSRAAKAEETNPTAAAAASIAAFHEAAKSVNEINLNEVESALKPKPDSSVDLESLGIDFISKLNSDDESNSGKQAETAPDPQAEKTVTESIADATVLPEKEEKITVDKTGSEDISAIPNANDIVVLSENKKTETSSSNGESSKLERISKTEAIEITQESQKGEQAKNAINSDAENKGDATTSSSLASTSQATKPPISPIAIVGLVFGIVAVIMAAITPFINFLGYAALTVGALALILSIVSLATMKNNKKSGKPAGILGIICGIAAVAMAVAFHFLMPATDATDYSSPEEVIFGIFNTDSGSSADTSSSDDNSNDSSYNQTDSGNSYDSNNYSNTYSSSSAGSTSGGNTALPGGISSMDVNPIGAHEDLSVGASVEYTNGLTVKVDSIKTGLTNNAGKQIVCVTVTYKNNGQGIIDYNSFDWKVQDSSGTLRTYTIYPTGENELNSGELSVGSTVTGNLYFEGPINKIIYEANYWNTSSNSSWTV